MPQIGWFEILIIVAIAIVVIGPKDFPFVLKKIGSWIGSIKRYVSNVQNEVNNLESNKDVTILASSPITKYQIFKYKNHAYGIQFHIEIKDTTVNEWGCVPEYKAALEEQLGVGALEKFDKEAKSNMIAMNNYSKILYSNFKKLI